MIYAPIGLPRTEAEITHLQYRYLHARLYSGANRPPSQIELTPGFEAHYFELLEYRLDYEKDRRIREIRYALNTVTAKLKTAPGNTFLIDYAARLEKRLEAMSREAVQP